MTPPIKPETPEQELARIMGQSTPKESPEEELARVMQTPQQTPADKLHAEFKSGRLQKRIARENINEEEQRQAEPSAWEQIGQGVLGAGTALPNIIPGAERGLAGIRSAIRGQTYEQALQDIKTAKQVAGEPAVMMASALPVIASFGAGAAPSLIKTPQIIGTLGKAFAKLPPAQAGAIWSGASGALESAPVTGEGGEGIGERAKNAAWEAAKGFGMGAALEYGSVAAKSKLAQNVLTNVKQRIRDTQAAAKPLYDAFREVGDLGVTPKLQEITQLPVVANAIKAVKGMSPTLSKLADTDSRVLDATRKMLGKKAYTASQGGVETGEAVRALDSAIEDALQTVAPDVSHSQAVGTFAKGMGEAEGVLRGSKALRFATRPQAAETKQAMEYGEEGFKKWLETATPEERQAAIEGIKGRLKVSPIWGRSGEFKQMGTRLLPSVELRQGTRLLREMGEPIIPNTWLAALRSPLPTNSAMGGGNMGGIGANAGESVEQVMGQLGAGPTGMPMPERTPTVAPRQLPALSQSSQADINFNRPIALLPERAGPSGTASALVARDIPQGPPLLASPKNPHVSWTRAMGTENPVVQPPHARWGMPETPAEAPDLGGGPRIPMPASVDEEMMKRMLSQSQARPPVFTMEDFLKRRDTMDPVTQQNFYRVLADLLRQIKP